MKRSRRELAIDMTVHKGILKFNQITLFPCSTFIPKSGASFYRADMFFPPTQEFELNLKLKWLIYAPIG